MGESVADWVLLSEHSGTFLRLQRLLAGKRSFTLCFLTYSDSAYRERAAEFFRARLGGPAGVRLDDETLTGTEELFGRLSVDPGSGPAQLSGLERWPEGIEDLLRRLNHRREALAAHCARPLLFWILSRDLGMVATGAADLWAWRSGVFDFSLGALEIPREPYRSRIDRITADAPKLRERSEELQQYLRDRSPLRPIDVDLLLELGDLQLSIGAPDAAEATYSRAVAASSGADDRRRWAMARGRIADIMQDRGQLEEALRVRTEEQLPVFERLGDARSLAITRGRIADIREARGELDEALRIRTEDEIPVYEHLGDARAVAIAKGQVADVLEIRGQLEEALRIHVEEGIPVYERLGDARSVAISRGKVAMNAGTWRCPFSGNHSRQDRRHSRSARRTR